MNKLFERAKLCAAIGLIAAASGCAFSPRSECELAETDGKSILGIDVVAVNKTDDFFGDNDEAVRDKNFRGCGYIAKYKTERGNLYWTETKSGDIKQAKRFYEAATEKLPDADDYSDQEITGIGEEARLSRFKHDTARKMEITVRKGKTVFSLLISKPAESEISVEEVKSLAGRIAGQTMD